MSDLDLLRDVGDQIVPPPLEALHDLARSRDRRMAGAVASATAAAVLAVTASAALLVGGDGRSGPQPTPEPTRGVEDSRPLTYAEGATVHYGEETVEAAGAVVELDLTDDGVVFRTSDGRIWFTDGTTPTALGGLGEPGPEYGEDNLPIGVHDGFVVSGSTGSIVAWLEFPSPSAPELVVYDGSQTARPGGTSRESGAVVYPPAMFGEGQNVLHSVYSDAVYWLAGADPESDDLPDLRLDLASGDMVELTPGEYLDEVSARSSQRMLLLGRTDSPSGTQAFDHYNFNWSVRGGRVEPQGAQPLNLRDAASGEKVEFEAPADYPNTVVVWMTQWVDDDTIVMLAERDGAEELFSCDIGGACEIAGSGDGDAFVVPEIG